jgi:hypothetical protein
MILIKVRKLISSKLGICFHSPSEYFIILSEDDSSLFRNDELFDFLIFG